MKLIRQYFYKILVILPLTFLLPPIFYAFLGYHPDMPVLFPLFVYLWHTLFIFLGATIAFILNKFKYLAYPVIIGIAFLCKNIIALPVFFQQALMDFNESSGEVIGILSITPDQIMYYTYILLITASISGFIGIIYSKKTAFDLTGGDSLFFFMIVYIISAMFYIFSGITDIDKNAGNVFAFCLTGFFVSYFIVLNYARINRELEIYGEKGAYNSSGINRIYKYYFSAIIITAVVPVFVAIVIVPFIIYILEIIINFIIAGLFALLLLQRNKGEKPPDPEFPADVINPLLVEKDPAPPFIYYISILAFLIMIVILIIVFRKSIKEFILFLFTRMTSPDYDRNKIINYEIITEAKKDKKSKPSYKDYLKKSKKIKSVLERFLFVYNYIFWSVIKKDENLKESATPCEVAEIYEETSSPAGLYQDLKYGQKSEEYIKPEILKNMTDESESFLQKLLKTKEET
ncbi:MAG: hypothetical protein FWF92_11820 [Oscillospiraceae bacterium]|nr:hypothetical protein [Oscillospiraceae bacterium]